MSKEYRVQITRFAEKLLKKVPKHIREALLIWTETIELEGVLRMRKIPGYRDEPLKGSRAGQRSSRLSRGYRVIYEEYDNGPVIVIGVLEVNKHEY